jgi:hypothetical protein
MRRICLTGRQSTMPHEFQGELEFDCEHKNCDRDGLAAWRESWRQQREEYARHLGLPLNQEVVVTLNNGLDLRGRLVLEVEVLFPTKNDRTSVPLRIGEVGFLASDIAACARV